MQSLDVVVQISSVSQPFAASGANALRQLFIVFGSVAEVVFIGQVGMQHNLV